jgi:leucyl-tRNA synthetase
MTLAPEHPLVSQITTPEQKTAVEAYVEATAKRSERDRMADVKTISGVFTGSLCRTSIHQRTHSGLDWRLCACRLRNRSCHGGTMWRRTRLCVCEFLQRTNGMPEIKNIFNVDISKEALEGCPKGGVKVPLRRQKTILI